ncbi:MAG: hypothetical protein ACREPI_04905 [Candidatus Dormibacterales bacterium]
MRAVPLSAMGDLQTYFYLFLLGAAGLVLVVALFAFGGRDWVRFVRGGPRMTVAVVTAALVFQAAFWALFVAGMVYGLGLHTAG